MRKIIMTFVVACLLLSLSVSVGTTFAASLSDSLILQLTETHTEDQIDVNVRLVTNSGITGMTLELVYNRSIFEYNGYERGSALGNLDLISTGSSAEVSSPIKFNWMSQSVRNDFSEGNILKIHLKLKPNAQSGKYEVGFNYDNGDITYVDNTNNLSSKSAIISKAVIDVTESKISGTEIVEEQVVDNSKIDSLLILGVVVFVATAATATTLIVIRKKRKERKKNWLKI